MGFRGTEVSILDLTGGQASNRPVTGLDQNQALLLANIHSLPGGGIRLRRGDTEINSSAFGGGAAFTGLQYFKVSTGDEFLVGIAGTAVGKIDYSGGAPDGTIDTITGGLTITGGQNNLWTSFVAGDRVYFVGGDPDASFSWDGVAGTATAVGGSFPTGEFGFFHNNRIFVGNLSGAKSDLKNSTIIDIEDFTGVGAGVTSVDANDGDELIGAAPLNTDTVLLFKRNSIHQLITTSAPFPRFPLFGKQASGTPTASIGAVGKKAIVIHEGLAYFITPQGRMKATNGADILDFPSDMDDVWDSVPKARLPFIIGYFEQGKNFRHIKWTVSITGGSSNSLSIIWDLDKKSWWRYPSGHAINVITLDTADQILYAGQYDGKIYKKNVANKLTDDSESNAGISGRWEWGWQTNNSFQTSLHPQRINVSLLGQGTGNLRIQYGFDFVSNSRLELVDMQVEGAEWDSDDVDQFWDSGVWAGQTDIIRNIFLFGRGNAFQ